MRKRTIGIIGLGIALVAAGGYIAYSIGKRRVEDEKMTEKVAVT